MSQKINKLQLLQATPLNNPTAMIQNSNSPRLMQQALSKQQDNDTPLKHNQQSSQVSITQNTGNLILQKQQLPAMKEWRESSKIKNDLTGISEFKQKVNIMLQNQMYLNMNSKQNFQEANSKFDLRKNENIWQPKDQVLENKIQHVPGMGYGYVLGINDLRELKDGKKIEEYEDIYQQANYENILLKNNRNQSVRKT